MQPMMSDVEQLVLLHHAVACSVVVVESLMSMHRGAHGCRWGSLAAGWAGGHLCSCETRTGHGRPVLWNFIVEHRKGK